MTMTMTMTMTFIVFSLGKHVLVVEDIVDTGLTISKLVEIVGAVSPKTLSVASLLLKRTPKSNGFVPDFVGFEVPDHFVVGFGIGELHDQAVEVGHLQGVSTYRYDPLRGLGIN
jgi:hypoxanthine phosphoribosyltransferase